MKKKTASYILIVLFMLVSTACLSTRGDSANGLNEPEEINAADTSADTEDDQSKVEDSLTGSDSESGPETIDLAGMKLFAASSSNYTVGFDMVYSGQDSSGNPAEWNLTMVFDVQTVPVPAYGGHSDNSGYFSKFAEIGGLSYYYNLENGCFTFPADPSQPSFLDNVFAPDEEALSGTITRVETDIMVNGTRTDKYAVNLENFSSEDFDDTTISAANLFIARNSGQAIRFELTGTTTLDAEQFYGDLAPGSNVDISYSYDFTPVDGPIAIVPPAECFDLVTQSDYPVMDDATNLTYSNGDLFYQSGYSADEIFAFYVTELAADGWTFEKHVSMGSFSSDRYSKDGVTILVTPFPMPTYTAVNIQLAIE